MSILTESEIELLKKELGGVDGNISPIKLDSHSYKKSKEIVDSSIQEAIQAAYDHKIMLFQLARTGATEPIRYHFHFLLTRKHAQHVAICLDTDDTVPLSNKNPGRVELHSVANAVLEAFISRAGLVDAKQDWMEQKLYFRRADQRLWDKFNEIKEKAFVNYAKAAIAQEKLTISGIKEESEIDFDERDTA